MDIWIGWMDRQKHGWIDGLDGRMKAWIESWMDKNINGWTDEQMDQWMDEQMEAWMDGQMDWNGSMDEKNLPIDQRPVWYVPSSHRGQLGFAFK